MEWSEGKRKKGEGVENEKREKREERKEKREKRKEKREKKRRDEDMGVIRQRKLRKREKGRGRLTFLLFFGLFCGCGREKGKEDWLSALELMRKRKDEKRKEKKRKEKKRKDSRGKKKKETSKDRKSPLLELTRANRNIFLFKKKSLYFLYGKTI